MGGGGACNTGDQKHGNEGYRIAIQCKIQFHKRIRKHVIHTDNTENGGYDSGYIAVGVARRQHDRQHEDDPHIRPVSPDKEKQGGAGSSGKQEN